MTVAPLNVIVIGAHPDDCEYYFGGTAVKMSEGGHRVKFLSLTNGDAGHHRASGSELAARRRAESAEAARRLGIAASEVLDYHDGLLEPTREARLDVIRRIRDWRADLVFTHRPWDYHPDHRATGQLVQDSAYLVLVPNICPESPVLRRNPVFLYLEDGFRKPAPFSPDIVVEIDEVWARKVDALDAHESQMYEWLPWADWNGEKVPPDPLNRKLWLANKMALPISEASRGKLAERYNPETATAVEHAESFELCEYGRQPAGDELDRMIPR